MDGRLIARGRLVSEIRTWGQFRLRGSIGRTRYGQMSRGLNQRARAGRSSVRNGKSCVSSSRHGFNVRFRKMFKFDPVGCQFDEGDEVAEVVARPLPKIVRLVVAKPQGTLGYSLDSGVTDELGDDGTRELRFDFRRLRRRERFCIVLDPVLKSLSITWSSNLFQP